jgi:hypothetical protein
VNLPHVEMSQLEAIPRVSSAGSRLCGGPLLENCDGGLVLRRRVFPCPRFNRASSWICMISDRAAANSSPDAVAPGLGF